MTDIMVGLLVAVIVGAALLYIRKEKKKVQSVLVALMQAAAAKANAPAIQNNSEDLSPAKKAGDFFVEKDCIETSTMLYWIANMILRRMRCSLWEEKRFITSTMTKTLVM